MLEVLQKQSDKILRRYSPDILLSIFSKIFSNVFLSQETWKYSKSYFSFFVFCCWSVSLFLRFRSSYLKIRTLTIQIFLNYLRFPFEKTGDSGIKIKNKVYLHFFDNESAIEIVMAPLIIGRIPGSLLTVMLYIFIAVWHFSYQICRTALIILLKEFFYIQN